MRKSKNFRSQNTFNENRIQQSNQSSSRFNRTDSAPSVRSREQNASRQSGAKVDLMKTTSTSPIPQRSTQFGRSNEDNISSTRSNWKSNKNDDQSSAAGKREERQTGGNTGVQEQSPWTPS